MTKPKANLSDHIRMDVRVELAEHAIRSLLYDILQYHVRKDSREYKMASKAEDALCELRGLLDDMVCRDTPDGIGHYCTQVYFGAFGHGVSNKGYDHGVYDEGVKYSINKWFDDLALKCADMLAEDANVEIKITDYDSSRKLYADRAPYKLQQCGVSEIEYKSMSMQHYALIPEIIRDFCRDAIDAGYLPTDEQIDDCVGNYAVDMSKSELDDRWACVIEDIDTCHLDYFDALEKSEVSLENNILTIMLPNRDIYDKLLHDISAYRTLSDAVKEYFGPSLSLRWGDDE